MYCSKLWQSERPNFQLGRSSLTFALQTVVTSGKALAGSLFLIYLRKIAFVPERTIRIYGIC